MTSLRRFSWIALSVSMLGGCVTDSEPGGVAESSFAVQCDPGYSVKNGECVAPAFTDIYQSIILTRCKGCHVSKAMGGLSLAQPEIAYENLLDVNADASGPCAKTKMIRVTPGN